MNHPLTTIILGRRFLNLLFDRFYEALNIAKIYYFFNNIVSLRSKAMSLVLSFVHV